MVESRSCGGGGSMASERIPLRSKIRMQLRLLLGRRTTWSNRRKRLFYLRDDGKTMICLRQGISDIRMVFDFLIPFEVGSGFLRLVSAVPPGGTG